MIGKIFENGRSQAIRIPKEYRMEGNEVLINKIGDMLLITPKDAGWKMFFEGIKQFPDDFFAEGRNQGTLQVREQL